MLMENGYQESIISRIFKRITNNHSLSQSQQQMQATYFQEKEIKMNINLLYVKCTGEKLRCILKSSKTRSTLYTESILCTFRCKPKYRVATENKNNIVYEIDCSDCEAVYSAESKRSLKSRSDEQKRSIRNSGCQKNEIAKHCWEANHNFSWDQKKVVDRESRLKPSSDEHQRSIRNCDCKKNEIAKHSWEANHKLSWNQKKIVDSQIRLKLRSYEHKRSIRNCDCEKNENAKHCWGANHNFSWDQKTVVDRESSLNRLNKLPEKAGFSFFYCFLI